MRPYLNLLVETFVMVHCSIKCFHDVPVPFDCPAVRVELGLSVVGRTVVTGAGIVDSALMMAQEMPLQAARDDQVRVVNEVEAGRCRWRFLASSRGGLAAWWE